ncbi:Pimeloyl-ACP methyl ester carboxylesterase [Parafrankia irregularis]|uniref:Pimeloyl-ACP methyl ester carboxylesterase n=1 Tax=Parafrankia irregularis TaxID=795642 RepID=A0A0S4QGM8_9ACTN|nr:MULTISPECIES: alpha/beta hydrolase [Parafrankia]MBE3200884.1 alpha/beta hydrolase [Parafrankia sp. CH37]CUU54720.1 Pimeloyl-ACP methyl ester carboxylesterase [Parafrankia irregularis]
MPTTTSSDGTGIYYEVHGTGPAVLFVHGSGGHHAAWWQQVPVLRDRFTVITLDLRGFGRSDSTMDEFDSRAFPDDITAVLVDSGVQRAVLVGQSIGAAAALRAALRRPGLAAGVVLAHSLGGIDHPDLAARVQADRAEAVKLPVLDRLLTPRFQAEEQEKTFLFRQMGTFNTAKMADLRNLNTDGPTVAELAGSGIPLCFLAGENDAVLRPDTVRAAAALLPSATLELVPAAPHSMYWEAPDLFNAALIRFLEKAYASELATAGASA